jgi:radical SAM protein with 4Fe4S-binding SPASM domain
MPDCSELAHPEIRWTAGTAGDFSRLRDFLVLNSPESGLTELLAAWNNRHLQVPDAPKLLNVEPTNHCNLKCIMCPRDKMTRAQGRMSLELFQQILHQASVQGVEQIVLNGYGEPFLHPEIFTMLKLLRNSGVQGRMYTNAQLLKPEYIEKLSAFPPHHLTISLDGFSQKTYEKIRRNGQYERVIANLEDLLQSRKSWAQTMKITLQQIQMPETKSESEGFKDFWQGRVDEISLPAMHNWGGHFADTERSLLQSRVRFPCKELWRTMMIFWDGRVSICCAAFDDDLIVGDLQKESLDEIWQGDKYRELRRLHAENRAGEIALCRHCDMWKYYG